MPKPCRHLLPSLALLARLGCAVDLHAAQRSKFVEITSEGSAEMLQDPSIDLAMKHVSKAGGSFMINVINNMTVNFNPHGRTLFTQYFSEYPVPEEDFLHRKDSFFLVSSIRNPCDWYVSQWAFASQFDKYVLDPALADEFFGDMSNKTKFAKWLWWAQGMRGAPSLSAFEREHPGPHFGVLSLRFWESFVAGRSDFPLTPLDPGYDTAKLGPFSRTYLGSRRVSEGLAKFTRQSAANCWVHVESYNEDLRACLQQYERVSAAKLDWAPFDREVSAAKDKRKVDHNDSKHKSCDHYYTPELAALVEKLDAPLFKAFGYGTCCGKATPAN